MGKTHKIIKECPLSSIPLDYVNMAFKIFPQNIVNFCIVEEQVTQNPLLKSAFYRRDGPSSAICISLNDSGLVLKLWKSFYYSVLCLLGYQEKSQTLFQIPVYFSQEYTKLSSCYTNYRSLSAFLSCYIVPQNTECSLTKDGAELFECKAFMQEKRSDSVVVVY